MSWEPGNFLPACVREGNTMDDLIIFPPDYLPMIEQTLREKLRSYVRADLPRCLIAFVGEKEIEVKQQFTTDLSWRILHGGLNEGLIGKALRTDQIETWKEGDSEADFLRGDMRTIQEFAATIKFSGKTTAVLLIDYFKTDGPERTTQWEIEQRRRELTEILEKPNRERNEIENHIIFTAGEAVKRTESTRGYIALKNWDGKLRYFTAGYETKRFRSLSQLEGICGEVLRTGVFQNAGNVWLHPQYQSSDDSIQSEAVAPINVPGGECVGVLNLESPERDHYTPKRVEIILELAENVVKSADRFRRPLEGGIGVHSRLLSDLVEQFSAPGDGARLGSEEKIWDWAKELCIRKIVSLDSVSEATFVDMSAPDEKGTPRFRSANDGNEPGQSKEKNGVWTCEFDLLADSITRSRVEVRFLDRPKRTTLEIIEQFCRLTSNEVRRRGIELRAAEFERFVAEIRRVSLGGAVDKEALLARMPGMLQRMMHCSHVTYFQVTERAPNGLPILRPWQSTAPRLTFSSEEYHYKACPEDGLTGFAASQTDVLLLKTMSMAALQSIDPRLPAHLRAEKITEDDTAKIRSLFAMPLFDGETLIGVFRGHRTARFIGISFTETDRDRLRLVQFLLGKVLSESRETAAS